MPVATAILRLTWPAAIRRAFVVALGGMLLLGSAWPGGVSGAQPTKPTGDAGDSPGIQYRDAMAHAHDRTTFTPGGAVTIPYTPRAGDRTIVDGAPAVALPAGSATGAAMAAESATSAWAAGETNPPTAGSDFQVAPATSGGALPAATTNVLRREVYGFLPYWELGYAPNYDVVSTIAYFGTGLNINLSNAADPTNGTLDKSSSGWSGWTSSSMTTLINNAHTNHDRVALTIESFAWGSSGAAAQTALLTNPTAVTTAVQQIAGAVRDRGADGVNLDFEPIAAGMSNYYVAFVRQLRIQLDSIHPGYELTFCGTGRPSTYDLGDLLATGAADDVFIMGYDFRTGSSPYAASLDPLTSPLVYDLNDAVNVYKANVPVSKIILGLPYYGIAYSTPNTSVYATNISGATYGDAVMSPYSTAATMAQTNLKQYDSIEQSAWVSYYGTYGGGTQPTWRELYYNDAQAMAARYDRVNYWNLRGVGMWVLGYDSGFPELNQALANAFLTDTNPPLAGITDLAPVQSSESFTVSWTGRDDWNGVKNYDVQVSTDGGAWTNWLVSSTSTSSSFDGQNGHNYAFRVRAVDGVGNIGPWDVSAAYTASPSFVSGGYATVVAGSVNERGQPTTSAGVINTAPTGTVFQIIGGPVSANGFTWYQVNGPIMELNPVTPPFPGAWIAVTDGTTAFMTPTTPPNTTAVAAGLGNLTIGTPGSPPSMTGIDAGRTFSPDGDGIRDNLNLSWTDIFAYTDVTLSVYRLDGSLAGVLDLGALGTGPQTYAWNGTTDGKTVLPDSQYMLKLTGTTGSTSYYSPSPGPFDAAAWANFGVILDTTPSGTYHPLAPVRILDTRYATGLSGPFVAGQPRSFPVGGHNGVPANAIAVTGNLTVTQATAGGYVLLGPTTTVNSSTINFPAGDDRANGVTVGLAGDGSLSAKYVSSTTGASVHLIFDLTGYFVRDANGATFIPVVPTRIVDTRSGKGLGSPLVHGAVSSFQVTGLAGVPGNATAVTGNATITNQTAGGFITLAPSIGPGQPTSSTINFPYGDVRANNVTVPLSGGRLQVEYWGSSGQSTQFVFDVTGYFVPGLSGATFVPLSPSRVVDSRVNQGFSGPLRIKTTAGFQVRGQVSVHLAAVAVVGNLTVTGQTSDGWLNSAPTATSATSTVNFPMGDTRANGFVCMLGPGGTLTVTYGGSGTTATSQVVVDIVGYYR